LWYDRKEFYDRSEFNHYFSAYMNSQAEYPVVVPMEGEDLAVQSFGTQLYSISVAPGMAICKDFIFVNSATRSFSLTKPSTANVRYDYVVVRIDYASQKIRLAVVEGTETAGTYPTAPTLTQVAGLLWEMPLALIYVSEAYGYVWGGHIQDLREFLVTHETESQFDTRTNMLRNSEFMAWGSGNYPEHWTGNVAWGSGGAIPSSMSRGRAIYALASSDTIYQRVNAIKDVKTYTLKGVSTGPVQISIYPMKDGSVLTPYFSIDIVYPATDHTYKRTFTCEDYPDEIAVYIHHELGSGNRTGQHILVPGYHPGPFRQFEEVIMLDTPLTNAGWTATAKATGTYTVDLDTFSTHGVQKGTRGAILRLQIYDTNSAGAASVYAYLHGFTATHNPIFGIVEIGNLTNNTPREAVIPVNVLENIYVSGADDPLLRVTVQASGTLYATLQVVGVII